MYAFAAKRPIVLCASTTDAAVSAASFAAAFAILVATANSSWALR
ncbi:unannotated protein [freshwater metagenome]|uniref:Unannotated protein n=1 Tax=freshwater metagenome TaxID=449393 RepID=A0A6J6EQL8_9ZZZZ